MKKTIVFLATIITFSQCSEEQRSQSNNEEKVVIEFKKSASGKQRDLQGIWVQMNTEKGVYIENEYKNEIEIFRYTSEKTKSEDSDKVILVDEFTNEGKTIKARDGELLLLHFSNDGEFDTYDNVLVLDSSDMTLLSSANGQVVRYEKKKQ